MPSVFRPGDVTYLRLPAPDPAASAAFYASVFGWQTEVYGAQARFADATGSVIGHFMSDLPAAGEAGVRPYVYVDAIDQAIERIRSAGGELVDELYPEGELWVATFRDPAGNVVGVWQRGPRPA